MKKILQLTFIPALFFLSAKCFAQAPPSPAWFDNYKHTPAPSFSNEGRKVAIDGAGNVFVLADATSNIDPNGLITSNVYHYTIILKYNYFGTLISQVPIEVFDHTTTGFDTKGAFGLELDVPGNVYVGYGSYNASSSFNIVLRKYNNSLSPVWTYTFNPSSNDFGIDMKVSSGGTVFAVVKSTSGSNTTFNLISAGSSGTSSTPLYSFNVNADVVNSMVLDGNSNTYVTGYSLVSGVKSALTARVSNTGTLNWKKLYDAGSVTGDDYGNQIILGSGGYLYVTGTSYAPSVGGGSNYDIMTFKCTASSGKVNWVSFQDYSVNDNGMLIATTDSFVYVGSVSGNTIGLSKLTLNTGTRNSRVQYNPFPIAPYTSLSGASLADMKVSSSKNCYLTGNILAINNNSQTFSASFFIKVKYDPTNRNNLSLQFGLPVEGDFTGNYSSVAMALDNSRSSICRVRNAFGTYANHNIEAINIEYYTLGTNFKFEGNSTIESRNDMLFFPNPAKDILYLAPGQNIQQILIYDVTGKSKFSSTLDDENLQVDISSLAPGIYFCKIIKDSGITTKKLIIE